MIEKARILFFIVNILLNITFSMTISNSIKPHNGVKKNYDNLGAGESLFNLQINGNIIF